jgi:hypothetical protein
MSVTVCIVANTLRYPKGGGHMWVYLNWALGLRAIGCEIVWLEGLFETATQTPCAGIEDLKRRLAPYRLDDRVSVWGDLSGSEVGPLGSISLEEAASSADLLLSLCYDTPESVVGRFRRSALVDIDPGLLQLWLSGYDLAIAPHDVLFTTGETIGHPGSLIPDLGWSWQYTPPCVSLEAWTPKESVGDAAFSTITHWWSNDWLRSERGDLESNEKRTGFLPYLDVPRRTSQPMELAMQLVQQEHAGIPAFMAKEEAMLRSHGWRVQDSWTVASTPWDYQGYIQRSRGEFSCAKPSCISLQNAWVSDRTLCYLASGKPAVVQHTGPSRILPDDRGILRFKTPEEAVRCLDAVAADYDGHCHAARSLVEEHFDAKRVARSVLERALP